MNSDASTNEKPAPDPSANPASLSISHLPPDVQALVLARAELARKSASEYWAYVAEQDAMETP